MSSQHQCFWLHAHGVVEMNGVVGLTDVVVSSAVVVVVGSAIVCSVVVVVVAATVVVSSDVVVKAVLQIYSFKCE